MYEIQAVIGDGKVIQSDMLIGTRIVNLPQNKSMIPFSEEFKTANGIPDLPFTFDGAKTIHPSIADFCRTVSVHGKIAYIEAFFFGGQGTQACSLWNTGIMVEEPRVGLQSINIALKFLEVKKEEGLDEFDTMGLGNFRKIEDWLY
jgi:hypothetical protein